MVKKSSPDSANREKHLSEGGLAPSRHIRQTDCMKEVEDQILAYDEPVVLVGASPVPIAKTFNALPAEWPVIAADGGVDALVAMNRQPDMIMGDMDSATNLPDDVPVMRLTGQDDTDLEKCLNRITAPLIIGLGFLEGRLDHTLAALHALMTLPHDRPVMLVGDSDVLVRLRGDFSMRSRAGARFSVWPLGCQAFLQSTGLKWSLDGLVLRAGQIIGTSNETDADTVTIKVDAGDGYAVIMPRWALGDLLAAITTTSR